MILVLTSNSKVGSLFNNKVIILFANISFPLYLLHWPAIVFLKYVYLDDPDYVLTIFILIAVIFMSYMVHITVEKSLYDIISYSCLSLI